MFILHQQYKTICYFTYFFIGRTEIDILGLKIEKEYSASMVYDPNIETNKDSQLILNRKII